MVRYQTQERSVPVRDRSQIGWGATLDLVVPFTTPELTRSALEAARRLGVGLDAEIRLLKIQTVPYPLQLEQSPIPTEFLEEQLRHLNPDGWATAEIVLTRDFHGSLHNTLKAGSVVILAARRRPWRTRVERLASSLRRKGHTVVIVQEADNHA